MGEEGGSPAPWDRVHVCGVLLSHSFLPALGPSDGG